MNPLNFLGTIQGGVMALAFLLATHAGAYYYGGHKAGENYRLKEAVSVAESEAAKAHYEAAQAVVVANLETKLKESNARTSKTREIIKEVPKYVTSYADNSCTLTAGAVWLSDLPLKPELSGSPPRDVDATATIKISEYVATTAENLTECVARGEIVDSWQAWYKQSKAAFESASKPAK